LEQQGKGKGYVDPFPLPGGEKGKVGTTAHKLESGFCTEIGDKSSNENGTRKG
jgi:hypothetical protein